MKSHSTYKLNTPVHASLDTSVHAKVDTSKRTKVGFGQIPKDILKRSDLSSDAKVLFCAVNMQSPGKENVAVSLRDLEKAVPFKKSKIGNLAAKLVKVGLLAPWKTIRGQVRIYRINHPNWTTVPEKTGRCPRCGGANFSIGPSGACQKCITELHKKIERSA